MDIRLPEKVNILINHLENCGYEAFAVGGCIRDSIMGRLPNDWDLCTSASPDEMKECFAGFAWHPAENSDSGRECRIIETGLQHGTLTVLLDGDAFEITTYRIDGEYSDGRHPDQVAFTRSLEEDLARRDFTVNAMAYNNTVGLVDPFGGQNDLSAKVLRCVGEPAKRFTEDSLRILRCIRFASQLGYSIENSTSAAMYDCLPLIDRVAVERIRVEFEKLLCGPAAVTVLRAHRDIIAHIIPEIRPMFDLDQKNAYHVYDVWEHTLHVIENIPADPLLRLMAFFHDIGKPPTMTVVPNERYVPDTVDRAVSNDPGAAYPEWGHFYGHEAAGAEITKSVLRRLKFDNYSRDTICSVIDAHKIVFQPTERHARRLLNKLGEDHLRMLIQLELADVKSQNPVYTDERVENIQAFEAALDAVLAAEQCFSMKHLAVNGKDMMELGVPQGQEIGRILNALLDQVVDGKLANEKALLLNAASNLIQK
jgi:tRNA nucleotidyltransferase (CCA-adding enzyme)